MVRNLAAFSGVVIAMLVAYTWYLQLPLADIVPLVLTAVLASIPVALPATFTLSAALGARALAARGVLATRLSAVEEAGTMDVLCADKTGTLTCNALTVSTVRPMPGFDKQHVLTLAALASAEGGQDPVDTALRAAASGNVESDAPKLTQFTAFDPTKKMSEASVTDSSGGTQRIVKGAFSVVVALTQASPTAAALADELERDGFRVLAVAAGAPEELKLVGLVALSDPPRADSAALVTELHSLGVCAVMVTGDAPATAAIVAHAVGLDGAICPPGPSRTASSRRRLRCSRRSCPKTNISSSRRTRRAATRSACAATAPTMRPHCARRKSALRFRRRLMSPSPPPAWC